jgi:hypothetical protein
MNRLVPELKNRQKLVVMLSVAESKHLYRFVAVLFNEAAAMLRLRGRQMSMMNVF